MARRSEHLRWKPPEQPGQVIGGYVAGCALLAMVLSQWRHLILWGRVRGGLCWAAGAMGGGWDRGAGGEGEVRCSWGLQPGHSQVFSPEYARLLGSREQRACTQRRHLLHL